MSYLKHFKGHISGDGIEAFPIQVTRDTEVGNVAEDMTGETIIFRLMLAGTVVQEFSNTTSGITATDIQNGLFQFDKIDSWALLYANYDYKIITIINGFTETLQHGYFPFVKAGNGLNQGSQILVIDRNSVSNVINEDSLVVIGSYPKFKVVINDIDAPYTDSILLLGLHRYDGGDQKHLSSYTKNINTDI
jgi:hypothetical protein